MLRNFEIATLCCDCIKVCKASELSWENNKTDSSGWLATQSAWCCLLEMRSLSMSSLRVTQLPVAES